MCHLCFFYCSTSTSVKSRYWQAVCSLSQVVRSAGDRYSRLALQDLWYCWIIDMQIFPAAPIKRLIYRQNMVKTKQKLTNLDYIHELCRVGPHYTVWYCMRMEATILILVRHNPTRQKKEYTSSSYSFSMGAGWSRTAQMIQPPAAFQWRGTYPCDISDSEEQRHPLFLSTD